MGKRVLLVDDTETVLMSVKLMLGGQGFEITTAKNGVDAVAKAASIAPDIILMDIQMPQMDGIEACRRVKSDPATKQIPVIMVTTRGEPEKVTEAFAAGCDDYLTKPIDKLELMSKIRRHIGG